MKVLNRLHTASVVISTRGPVMQAGICLPSLRGCAMAQSSKVLLLPHLASSPRCGSS